jgi:hypothetical protein
MRIGAPGDQSNGKRLAAQAELGDIVYVELPEIGKALNAGETFGVVESVKVSGMAHQERGAAGQAAESMRMHVVCMRMPVQFLPTLRAGGQRCVRTRLWGGHRGQPSAG